MAARSRRSAARCRCSTSTVSPRSSIWRRSRSRRAHQAGDRPRDGPAGLERRLWPVERPASNDDDLWLDAFVTDFLTRARERNFAVPQQGFDQALDRLRNEVVNAADPSEGAGEPLAYALYVLARNGRPVIGDLRYLADTKLDAFKTPLARGAARRRAGDARRPGARRQGVRRRARRRSQPSRTTGCSRPDYGSRLRDGAGTAGAARRGQAQLRRSSRRRDRRGRRHRRQGARRAHLHQHAGEELDGARRRGAGRARARSASSRSTASRSKGALYRNWARLRPRPAISATLVNDRRDAGAHRHRRFGQSDRARAGRVAGLRDRAHLLQARRHEDRRRRPSRRTTAWSSS